MLTWLRKKDKTKIHNFNLKYFDELELEIKQFELWRYNLQNKKVRTKQDDIMQRRIEFMIDDFNSIKKAVAI